MPVTIFTLNQSFRPAFAPANGKLHEFEHRVESRRFMVELGYIRIFGSL